nr:MAG TPA: hypothetical protein [Caudoviricetes sp.]
MDQHLTDPNRPLTVSVLRGALEQLEAAGHGDAPVSLYAADTHRLIQAHNITPDRSAADRPHAPALSFCSTWDTNNQTDNITNFVIL